MSLNNLGISLLLQGRAAEARQQLEEAIALQRQIGDRWSLANALNNLGNVARQQQQLGQARKLYTESLLINKELGDKWSIAYLLEDVAHLALLEAQYAHSVTLLIFAHDLRKEIGAPPPPSEAETRQQLLTEAKQELDATEIDKATSAGQSLSVDEALSYALEVTTKKSSQRYPATGPGIP